MLSKTEKIFFYNSCYMEKINMCTYNLLIYLSVFIYSGAKPALTDVKTSVPRAICSYYQNKENCGNVPWLSKVW